MTMALFGRGGGGVFWVVLCVFSGEAVEKPPIKRIFDKVKA
jgi:hypothetical protein